MEQDQEQVDDDLLVRRLRNLHWPEPPSGARERGWAAIEQHLEEFEYGGEEQLTDDRSEPG
jgi:hypothetical protein